MGDISLPEFATDDFRMYCFKVLRCPKRTAHEWKRCVFAHPSENARRRDPRRHSYCCYACPDYKQGFCIRGDACQYAHGIFECWLHPSRYRSRLCNDGVNCKRPICFFAHTVAELRNPAPQWENDLVYHGGAEPECSVVSGQSVLEANSADAAFHQPVQERYFDRPSPASVLDQSAHGLVWEGKPNSDYFGPGLENQQALPLSAYQRLLQQQSQQHEADLGQQLVPQQLPLQRLPAAPRMSNAFARYHGLQINSDAAGFFDRQQPQQLQQTVAQQQANSLAYLQQQQQVAAAQQQGYDLHPYHAGGYPEQAAQQQYGSTPYLEGLPPMQHGRPDAYGQPAFLGGGLDDIVGMPAGAGAQAPGTDVLELSSQLSSLGLHRRGGEQNAPEQELA